MPSPRDDQIPLVNGLEDIEVILKNPKSDVFALSDGIFKTLTFDGVSADSEPGISAAIQHMREFFSALNVQESLLEIIEGHAREVSASETATDLQRKDARDILQMLVCLGACLKGSDIHGAVDSALRVGIAYDRMNVRPAAPRAKRGRENFNNCSKGGKKSGGIPKGGIVTEPLNVEKVIRDYDDLISKGMQKAPARRRVCKKFGIQERTFYKYQVQIRTA